MVGTVNTHIVFVLRSFQRIVDVLLYRTVGIGHHRIVHAPFPAVVLGTERFRFTLLLAILSGLHHDIHQEHVTSLFNRYAVLLYIVRLCLTDGIDIGDVVLQQLQLVS